MIFTTRRPRFLLGCTNALSQYNQTVRSLSIVDNLQNEAPVLQRSFMYVPGDKMPKIEKIAALTASSSPDMVVLDMEDGVGYAQKSAARDNIFSALNSHKFQSSRSQISIRINSIDSGLADEDIKAVFGNLPISSLPHMMNLPKLETTEQLDWLADRILANSQANYHPIWLTVMVESALSIINLPIICRHAINNCGHAFRLQGLVFGSDDFCASIGVQRSPSNSEVLFARQNVVTAAKAFSLSAIDMVDIDLKDEEALSRNCEFGAQLGFTGKQVIHPNQLKTVHETFLPSRSRMRWAIDLLNEFEKQKKEGQGVFVFRGQMIDMPSVLQARYIKSIADKVEALKLS